MTKQDLIEYIDAVGELAASVESDIKKGERITSRTVLALSTLVSRAQKVQEELDGLQKDRQTKH